MELASADDVAARLKEAGEESGCGWMELSIGCALEAEGRWFEACTAYDAAAKAGGRPAADALRRKACVLWHVWNQLDEAADAFAKGREAAEPSNAALFEEAVLLKQMKQTTASSQILQEMTGQLDVETLLLSASNAADLGDWDGAAVLLRAALEREGEKPVWRPTQREAVRLQLRRLESSFSAAFTCERLWTASAADGF
eukprot:PLAT15349.1.p1 GENE.PLAT15349.1~~PLAT15349.1.p1  ORF type:complete len:199 (+),score=59.30 PLAT15349.1:57-653(+)